MRNLTAIAILALALSPLCATGQTTKTLTLSSNGVVSKPTDFWSVNAAGIRAGISLGANVVMTDTPQTITGNKIFTGATSLNGTTSIVGPSLAGNQTTPALSLSQMWNTTGAPTALSLDVTDTASGAGSLLMDLRSGGVSRFSVSKSGSTSFSEWAPAAAGFQRRWTVANTRIAYADSSAVRFAFVDGALSLNNSTELTWTSGTDASNWTPDVRLLRDAAGVLALRNGTNPQTFRVANTWSNASNNERIDIGWSGNASLVGPAASGNGTLRAMTLTGSTVSVLGNTVLGDAAGDAVTINAATITAPNQTAASATSVMTRDLVDARFLWRLANWYYRERDLVGSPLSPGITTYSSNGSVSNGGGANGFALAIATNATATGNATANGLMPGGFMGNGNGANGDNQLFWNRPMVMWIDFIAEAWRTGNTVRFYWGQSDSYRSGPMTANGVGFEITGATARGAVRNTTTSTTTTTASMIARRNYRLMIVLNGTVAEFFVNGTSLGTLAVPSGNNGWPNQYSVAVIENDGSAAATYLILIRTGFGFLLQP